MPNPHDPPFKLPLKTDEARPFVVCDAQHKTVVSVYGVEDVAQARARKIRDDANAHDRLAEFTRRYRAVCEVERQTTEANGLDVLESSWADDIREIDAALENKEP